MKEKYILLGTKNTFELWSVIHIHIINLSMKNWFVHKIPQLPGEAISFWKVIMFVMCSACLELGWWWERAILWWCIYSLKTGTVHKKCHLFFWVRIWCLGQDVCSFLWRKHLLLSKRTEKWKQQQLLFNF